MRCLCAIQWLAMMLAFVTTAESPRTKGWYDTVVFVLRIIIVSLFLWNIYYVVCNFTEYDPIVVFSMLGHFYLHTPYMIIDNISHYILHLPSLETKFYVLCGGIKKNESGQEFFHNVLHEKNTFFFSSDEHICVLPKTSIKKENNDNFAKVYGIGYNVCRYGDNISISCILGISFNRV